MTRRSHAEPAIPITLPRRDWKALKDAAFAISVSPITSRKMKQLSSQVTAVLGNVLASGDAKTIAASGDATTVTVVRPKSSWLNLLSLFAEAPAGVLHRAAWDAAASLHRRLRELERPEKREAAIVPNEETAGARESVREGRAE
jgi:hypothetical protein